MMDAIAMGQGKGRGTAGSREVRQRWWRPVGSPRRAVLGATILVILGGTGCSLDGLLNSDKLPPDVSDPAITQTPQGARNAYNGTLVQFRTALGQNYSASTGVPRSSSSFVVATGLLSDELMSPPENRTVASDYNAVDRRTLPTGEDLVLIQETYSNLQKLRGQASQAIGLLTNYLHDPDQPALIGHLYALQGYAEIFLADLFCSGVPLGTLDYHGDFTYQPGSRTEQVFTHAAALFDTALALAGDSARIINLARVGRARALLALGNYAQAAAAAGVPDGYAYNVSYKDLDFADGGDARNFAYIPDGSSWVLKVSDREGRNGLDYRTSGDPRTHVTVTNGTYHPDKYAIEGSSPIVLASGVEARLIEAEAALQVGDITTWLAKLNALRTDGTSSGITPPDTLLDTLGVTGCGPSSVCGVDGVANGTFEIPSGYTLAFSSTIYPVSPEIKNHCRLFSNYTRCSNNDSTTVNAYVAPARVHWNPGSGGVDGLGPLVDPGTTASQVNLLFRERAFWLFLTGHRQGDLRRLIRQYHLSQDQVYPIGLYPVSAPPGPYGDAVTTPIPKSEFANPLFTGCISRDA